MGYLVAFVSILTIALALGADEKVMKTRQLSTSPEVEESELKHLFTRIGGSNSMMDLFQSLDLPESVDEQKLSQVGKANDLQSIRRNEVLWRRPTFLLHELEPKMQEDSSFMDEVSDTRYKNRMDKRMLGLFAHATLRSEPSSGMTNRKLTTRLSGSPTTGTNGGPLRIHGLVRNSMPRLRWG